jgi:hypothetical protein
MVEATEGVIKGMFLIEDEHGLHMGPIPIAGRIGDAFLLLSKDKGDTDEKQKDDENPEI